MPKAIVSTLTLRRALEQAPAGEPVSFIGDDNGITVTVGGMCIGGEAPDFVDFDLDREVADRLIHVLRQLREQPVTIMCDTLGHHFTIHQISI